MQMESGPLSDATVVELAAQFTCARWPTDLDNSLVIRYDIDEIPAVLFFSPQGSLVHRVPSVARMSSAAVALAMRQALAASRKVEAEEAVLLERLASAPRELGHHDAYGKFLRGTYRYAEAREAELGAFQLAGELGAADLDRRLAELCYLALKTRDFGESGKAIRTFLAQYPDSAHRERIEFYHGLHEFHGRGHLDEAAKIWEEQLNRFPGGDWSGKARETLSKTRRMMGDRERLGTVVPEAWVRRDPEAGK